MDPGVRCHGMKANPTGYLWSEYECFLMSGSQVSYRFLALGCFPANLVSDVVRVLCVLRVGSLKG